MGVQVTGLKELSKACKAIDKGLQKELLKIGKDAAKDVADAAKPLARHKSGRMAGAIRPGSMARGAYVAARGEVYFPVQHFGWARHSISPNPFLYDALDARMGEVIERYERQVAEFIDRNF